MEYFSTTSLAQELDLSANELFAKLKEVGWIDRKNDKWVLTDLGKQQGGRIENHIKYGEYIVWPENVSIDVGAQKNSEKLLNATAIGKQFNVSSQRINLILSELGFIENDVDGWQLTKVGKNNGGKQFKHDQSGKYYALWPNSILTNRSLTEVFQPGINLTPKEDFIEKPAVAPDTVNFRQKYPASYRTQDGHFVRSRAEVIIDDFLYYSGLVHTYEKKLPISEDVMCDFYIPSGNGRPKGVYIEFWGMENDTKYQERMKAKIDIYKRNGLSLIQLTDSDLQNLDDVLTRKLLEFKITVGV
jgi:hypothetical protein